MLQKLDGEERKTCRDNGKRKRARGKVLKEENRRGKDGGR